MDLKNYRCPSCGEDLAVVEADSTGMTVLFCSHGPCKSKAAAEGLAFEGGKPSKQEWADFVSWVEEEGM